MRRHGVGGWHSGIHNGDATRDDTYGTDECLTRYLDAHILRPTGQGIPAHANRAGRWSKGRFHLDANLVPCSVSGSKQRIGPGCIRRFIRLFFPKNMGKATPENRKPADQKTSRSLCVLWRRVDSNYRLRAYEYSQTVKLEHYRLWSLIVVVKRRSPRYPRRRSGQ